MDLRNFSTFITSLRRRILLLVYVTRKRRLAREEEEETKKRACVRLRTLNVSTCAIESDDDSILGCLSELVHNSNMLLDDSGVINSISTVLRDGEEKEAVGSRFGSHGRLRTR